MHLCISAVQVHFQLLFDNLPANNVFFLEAWDTSIVLQVRIMQPLLINQPGPEDVSPLSLPP